MEDQVDLLDTPDLAFASCSQQPHMLRDEADRYAK